MDALDKQVMIDERRRIAELKGIFDMAYSDKDLCTHPDAVVERTTDGVYRCRCCGADLSESVRN